LRTPTLYTFGEEELLNLKDRTTLVLRMRSGMLDGQLYHLREVGEKVGSKKRESGRFKTKDFGKSVSPAKPSGISGASRRLGVTILRNKHE